MRALSILVIATALAAGCSSDEGAEANEQAQAQAKAEAREARIGPVGMRYDSTRLAIASVQVPLPPEEKRQVKGMKLIAREREPLLDQGRCPEQAGNVCRPEAEGGLTLTVLNQSFAEFSAPIPRTRPATVAGVTGVAWDGKFGGTAATFTLLPAQQQTLMMIRQTGGEGAPDAALLDAVVATLTFTPPEEPPAR
jgi:hypothetical protein